MRLSHEAIYRSIYIAERKALARCLGRPSRHLRSGRTMRVPRAPRVSNRGRLRNMVSIHRRPSHIEERTQVGHWVGDLVRHEALFYRAEVEDLRRCAVVAA